MKAIESKNKDHGFHGTTIMNRRLKVAAEWPAAFAWVHEAVPVWDAATVRDFLDSTFGRHLADEAYGVNGIANVDPQRWMRSFWDFAEEVEKTGGLEGIVERRLAERELQKAEEQLRNAAVRLKRLLEVLPGKGKASKLQESFRNCAENQLEMIRAYFGEEE